MGNDIAGKRIPCKPLKLQAMLATVQIGRGSWRKVWRMVPQRVVYEEVAGAGV